MVRLVARYETFDGEEVRTQPVSASAREALPELVFPILPAQQAHRERGAPTLAPTGADRP